MEKVGFLIKVLRENSLDSVFTEIQADEINQCMNGEFSERFLDKLPTKESIAASDMLNALSARWMELAYLRGIKDSIQLLIDLKEKPLVDIYNACCDDAEAVIRDKVVLHLPKFKYQEQLIAVYDKPFREELFSKLREGGYDSWYLQSIMSTYEGREFGEDILTIYGDAGTIVEIFKDTVKNNHDELGQNSYVYEVGNELYLF